ncbi:hypothetical protein KHA80_17400 [Anaerobacillus sp. HL2]|nr:hypothetical protein KHA80_17400 [Anaerobacillus sp. HL2]
MKMMTNEIQIKDELPVVLNILAEFYKYPLMKDFYNEVAHLGNIDKELKSLFSKLKLQIKPNFQTICPSLKELQLQFYGSFFRY